MSKIVRSPRNMKTKGQSGFRKNTTPMIEKICQPKIDKTKQLKGKKPGKGLDDYSLDVMILE